MSDLALYFLMGVSIICICLILIIFIHLRIDAKVEEAFLLKGLKYRAPEWNRRLEIEAKMRAEGMSIMQEQALHDLLTRGVLSEIFHRIKKLENIKEHTTNKEVPGE